MIDVDSRINQRCDDRLRGLKSLKNTLKLPTHFGVLQDVLTPFDSQAYRPALMIGEQVLVVSHSSPPRQRWQRRADHPHEQINRLRQVIQMHHL